MDDVDDFECDDFDKTLKVIVVGNGNVGKTSMTTRYAKGRYTGNYKKTIGVDFMEKRLELRDIQETVNLMIWDTAGQEEFGALTSRYYKGASAVIYVFSTTDRASFDALPKWQRKVEEECGRISHVLVQNKIDLVDDAAMSRREVEDMADDLGVRLFRSCVQDNVNVHEVFEYICRQYLKRSANGSNGRDDACHAVADISMLSEAAAAATLKGSQPSPTYERRSRGGREISDQSDSGSTMSEGRQGSPPSPTGQRQRGWGTRDGERVSSSRFDRGDESKDRPRSKRHEAEDEEEGRRGGRSAGSRRDDRQRGWDCDDREDRDRPRGDAREDRDRDRPRDRYREFERSRDRDRDGDRVRDRDRGRGQGRSRDGDNDRDLDRGRDRDRPRERDDRNDRIDRGRDRERRRDEDRARDHPPSNERGPSRYDDEREAVDVEASRSSDRDRKKQKDQPRGEARRPQGTSDNDRPLKEAGLKAGSGSPAKEESVRESEADAGAIPASSSTADKDGSFPQDSRQNSLSILGTDRATPKDRKRTGSPESERTLDVDLRKPVDKATLRAQLREGQDDSEEESAFGVDDCGAMGNPSTIASESSRIQPSKRRTNGKKTNPLLRKMGKLVYG